MQQIKPTRTSVPTAAPRRFDVFVVEDYTKDGEEKASWIRLGVAFENKDGRASTCSSPHSRSAARS